MYEFRTYFKTSLINIPLIILFARWESSVSCEVCAVSGFRVIELVYVTSFIVLGGDYLGAVTLGDARADLFMVKLGV